jgi:hypothetical protein
VQLDAAGSDHRPAGRRPAARRIDAGLLIPPLPDKAQAELDYLKVLEEPLVLCAARRPRAPAWRRAGALRRCRRCP